MRIYTNLAKSRDVSVHCRHKYKIYHISLMSLCLSPCALKLSFVQTLRGKICFRFLISSDKQVLEHNYDENYGLHLKERST